jgi:hypothetical protein
VRWASCRARPISLGVFRYSASVPASVRSKPSALKTASAKCSSVSTPPCFCSAATSAERNVSRKMKSLKWPGLQRGVLPVVGKAEQFARVRLIRRRIAQLEELAHRAQREHGGGRRAPFAREAGQSVHVFAVGLVREPATQAEAELAWNEPIRPARGRFAPVGSPSPLPGLRSCRRA